ncbi:peptidase S8/S53 domain-containing protein [Suillus subalutaceus]|uniref:peptidase S8/S53 domain-containing protein n=1 Tax=Suillus subalutaceus TaxID=48586 RepID=UPI001B87145E|nr:peptidase S8/S53 domain-containing protein [Suillus subalutaceus]KAG1873580.1 peptidase S8/S53 domain-containing protein [Suillus subalutaceus]
MKFVTLLVLPFAAALASTVSFEGCKQKVKESIHGPPHGWYKHAPAPKHHMLELKIALPQPKFPELEQHLWEISDPSHARYGAYLSKQETEALMAPHPETLDIVSEWLALHGLAEEDVIRSSARDWVTIRVPVGLAEEMLDTTYHVYKHAETGESIVRTTSYSLPDILHHHVDLIQPTTMFARFKAFKSTLHWANQAQPAVSYPPGETITGPAGNPVDASCNSTITLSCLKQLYNAESYTTSATNCNKLGLTGYLDQYANNKDLQQFYQAQNPSAYGSNYTLVSINGGKNNQSYEAAGGEANLDTQFGFGLAWPTPGMFYTTAGEPPFIPDVATPNNTNEPYTYWLDYVLSQDDVPQTISTSYGDREQTVPYTYATRVCAGMASLGARGVSLLFSSGDSGVGAGDPTSGQECQTNDGHNVTKFQPTFPASCPYTAANLDQSVTAVGGTVNIPETAVDFSSGGFSNYFARPAYQEAAVSAYLTTLAPGTYEGLYNCTGRAFPDVAAQSVNFSVIYQGQATPVAGTSCASPAFAAFVSMLNDARINAQKAPLGFLNPFLYSAGYNALNDITAGSNPGCGTPGFNATVGWDPVTGYGTPNFEKLKDLVLAMP